MNSIDLSLAPKDATHYTKETKTTNACWINIKQAPFKYVTMSEVHHNKDSYIWQIGEFPSSELIEIDIKPVYTQAMADAGVMPSVGMEVMHLAVKKVVMLPTDLNSKYVLNSVNDFYSLALIHDIKPLDTRTDTEKAIADIKDKALGEGNDAAAVFNLIKDGNIHGVTWSGK